MHVTHVPVRCHDTKFIEPHTLVLLQDLADNFTLNLRPRCLENFLERHRIAALHGLTGTLLIDAALEITAQVTTIHDRTRYWRGQGGKHQDDQPSFHVKVSA